MSKKTGTLGNSYQQSVNAQLELETRMMEEKLKSLQEKMLQQKHEDDAAKEKAGGVRWKASQPKSGSLSNFGKEISEKYKSEEGVDPVQKALLLRQQKLQQQQQLQQQLPFPGYSNASNSNNISNIQNMQNMQRQDIKQADQNTPFGSKDVSSWSTSDVSQWLTMLCLNQYIQVFVSNEISGNLLLDLSLEDLDYMSITILGHRKTIMRGIEDLRKNKRVTFSAGDIKASTIPSNADITTPTASMVFQSQKYIPSLVSANTNSMGVLVSPPTAPPTPTSLCHRGTGFLMYITLLKECRLLLSDPPPHSVFVSHTKTKAHQKWLEGLNRSTTRVRTSGLELLSKN